jgi:hypothetical protein
MKYVKDVPMLDQQGNQVKGIGIVNDAGTCVASAIARKNPSLNSWSRPNTQGHVTRTIAFGDVCIQQFMQTLEPDEDGFVTGVIPEDGIILRHTPFYVMQVKKVGVPDSQADEPFINSIANYVYRQNDRSSTRNQKFPLELLYGGKERKELLIAAINKSCEVLNELDEKGITTTTARKNNAFAQGSAAIMNMVGRHKDVIHTQEHSNDNYSVDNVIPS